MTQRLQAYIQLMRLDKPIGILLLLWPTLSALLFAARGLPPFKITLIFVLGVILMRSAGCCVNDWADRKIDPQVERTRMRPLGLQWVAAREALYLCGALMLLAFILVCQTNRQTIQLACIAALLACSYPFMKRITDIPQVVLGCSFSMGILMSFTAVRGELDGLAYVLFLANVLWILAYDTQYALADLEYDLKIGVRSTAILFGRHVKTVINVLQVSHLAIMASIGVSKQFPITYYGGLTLALCLVIYQSYLIANLEPKRCIHAFLNNNYLGLLVLLSTLVAHL